MPLLPQTIEKVTGLLLSHVQTERERIALLTLAFIGSPIRYHIDTSGSPQVFVNNLIAQSAGCPIEEGQTALWRILETIKKDVGHNIKAEVDALRDAVNIAAIPSTDKDPYTTRRSDVLFLLVGRNPLPNYVAAQHLVNPGGKIYLVHTDGTAKVAENLRRYMGRDRCERILIEALEPDDIYQKIVNRVPRNTNILGLNYTGGTKIMAIQAYRAIQNSGVPQTIYSYLDAGTLRIVFEGNHAPEDAMANNLKISFYELLEIHGWIKASQTLETQPIHLDLAKQLANASETDQQLERAKAAKKSRVIGDDNPNDKWFRQNWLIDWALASIPEGCRRARNLTLGEGISKLELDVAFMKGYQLVALACAPTDDEDVAKLKFFETADIARRLGGDEACIGLVSLVKRPDRLERRLAHKWETRPERIKVFGRANLSSLAEDLENWINDMEGKRYA